MLEQVENEIYRYWNEGGGGYYLAEDALPDIQNAPTIGLGDLWPHAKWTKDHTCTNCGESALEAPEAHCYYHTIYSFGFNIVKEDTEVREDGSVHWTIREADLHEVSVVTFPAYEETSVSARKKDFEQIQKRRNEHWKLTMTKRLKGEC